MTSDARVERWSENGLDALDSGVQWLPMNTTSVTAAYSMNGKDKVILADATAAPFTVTLPNAGLRRNQQPLTVKRTNSGGNAVTVGSAGGTIDGASTVSLVAQYATRQFVSDGTNWHIIASS